MQRRLVMLCLLLMLCNIGMAQSLLGIEAGGQVGVFTARSGDRGLMFTTTGAGLHLRKQSLGKQYWQQLHGYPIMGLAFSARNTSNSRVYGSVYTCVPYLEFSLLKSRGKHLYIRHGTGIGYATKTHQDIVSNELLSTKLNAASFINAGIAFHASNHVDIKLGVEVNHVSNGNITQPNRGMNSLLFYTGVGWHASATNTLPRIKDTIHPPHRKWIYKAAFTTGLHNYNRNTETINKNYQASATVFLQHDPRFRTGLGFEVSDMQSTATVQPSILITEEVAFGQIATQYSIGVYLRGDLPANYNRVYEKVGVAWYPLSKGVITKGGFIGTAIKAHSFNAAHIELSAGYAF